VINPDQPDFSCTPVSSDRPGYPYASADPAAPPLVSILTAYHNTDESFVETARSLFAQSLQVWEWLIVDDGSTDTQSLSRLADVASSDPRIRVITQDNAGPAAARNRAFKHSVGRYVALLDSDDLLEPSYLEKCVWFLESHTEFGFCNAWTVNFGEEEFLWRIGFERGKDHLKANSGPIFSVVRREAFQASGGFDTSITFGHEDWDFWLALANAGYWGYTIREYLQWYRKRKSGRCAQVLGSDGVHRDFERMVATKYSGLEARFPEPQRAPPDAFEAVSSEPPFSNPLRKQEGGKRILLLVPWMVTGGADRVNLDWIDLLRNRGYQVTVCATIDAHHNWLPEFAKLTPDIFVLPAFLRLVDFPRFVLYLIGSRQIDTVLVTGSTLGYQMLPYLRTFCPEVTFLDLCHAEEPHWLNGGHPRFGVGYQEMIDLNIVTTRDLRDWMVRRGGEASRIEVCYSGIELRDRSLVARSSARNALALEGDMPVVTFAGRICEQKRPLLLPEIFRELRERGAPFQALLIGDGELRPALERLIEKYSLRSCVRFLGTVDHGKWMEALRASDIFLLPSQYEGISVALLEAMSLGVVPVVAAVGGQAEAVTPDCGFLIPQGAAEVSQYVEALAQLIDDPVHRQIMGELASRRVEESFSHHTTAERLVYLIERARQLSVSAPRQPPGPGFARELATLAVEYARITTVADTLWSHWVQTKHGGSSGAAVRMPLGEMARLFSAIGGTRLGAAIIANKRLRRLAGWVINRLEARRKSSAESH